MVLKELIFDSFYVGRVVVMKKLILTLWEGVVVFLLWEGVVVLK